MLLSCYYIYAAIMLLHVCCYHVTTCMLLSCYYMYAAIMLLHVCCYHVTTCMLLSCYYMYAAIMLLHVCCYHVTTCMLLHFTACVAIGSQHFVRELTNICAVVTLMVVVNMPFSFSRDHSAILEAAQTYCRYIGVLALGVLRVLRIYVAEGKN